jgi:hypothetical protein
LAHLDINGHIYRTAKLKPQDQFNVARRLLPVVAALKDSLLRGGQVEKFVVPREHEAAGGEHGLEGVEMERPLGDAGSSFDDLANQLDSFVPLMDVISKMSDEDSNYITGKCLAVTQRAIRSQVGEVTSWSNVVSSNGELMYEDDIDMMVMLQISWAVIRESLSRFF